MIYLLLIKAVLIRAKPKHVSFGSETANMSVSCSTCRGSYSIMLYIWFKMDNTSEVTKQIFPPFNFQVVSSFL